MCMDNFAFPEYDPCIYHLSTRGSPAGAGTARPGQPFHNNSEKPRGCLFTAWHAPAPSCPVPAVARTVNLFPTASPCTFAITLVIELHQDEAGRDSERSSSPLSAPCIHLAKISSFPTSFLKLVGNFLPPPHPPNFALQILCVKKAMFSNNNHYAGMHGSRRSSLRLEKSPMSFPSTKCTVNRHPAPVQIVIKSFLVLLSRLLL